MIGHATIHFTAFRVSAARDPKGLARLWATDLELGLSDYACDHGLVKALLGGGEMGGGVKLKHGKSDAHPAHPVIDSGSTVGSSVGSGSTMAMLQPALTTTRASQVGGMVPGSTHDRLTD